MINGAANRMKAHLISATDDERLIDPKRMGQYPVCFVEQDISRLLQGIPGDPFPQLDQGDRRPIENGRPITNFPFPEERRMVFWWP